MLGWVSQQLNDHGVVVGASGVALIFAPEKALAPLLAGTILRL